MIHELVAFPNGSFSVKPLSSEESMHSHIGPWQEAEVIYIGQSRLAERLSRNGPPLVVFDLGMGIAANALAAVECFLASDARRDLHLISFERHLDGLRLALRHSERFPWLERQRAAVQSLLAQKTCSTRSPSGAHAHWRLCEGDFLLEDLSALPPADLVFFDFYSPKSCPELWEVECFEKIRSAASSHAELFTYSASTAVRSSMLLAGWCVGQGMQTQAKSETTIAAISLQDLKTPLGQSWLDKLGRSERPLPPSQSALPREQILKQIRLSPQFRGQERPSCIRA